MTLVKRMSSMENDISEIKSLLLNQSTSKIQKEILTAQEVLDLRKINRNTFTNWKNIGLLKVYSINRRLYCKYSEILESLENGIIQAN